MGVIESTAKLQMGVLSELSRQPSVGTDQLPGVSFRVDLSRGLTGSAHHCLSLFEQMHVYPTVLVAVARSGDLAYAREGQLILDPQALESLHWIQDDLQFPIGLLADPGAIINRALNSPSLVWQVAMNSLAQSHLAVKGIGSSFRSDLNLKLHRVWLYRAIRKLKNQNFSDLLSGLHFDCREWLYDELHDGIFKHPLDGLLEIEVGRSGNQEARYLRDFLVTTELNIQFKFTLGVDFIVFSDNDGWHLLTAGGDVNVSPLEVCTFLESAQLLRGIIAVDPADIVFRGAREGATEAYGRQYASGRKRPSNEVSGPRPSNEGSGPLEGELEMASEALSRGAREGATEAYGQYAAGRKRPSNEGSGPLKPFLRWLPYPFHHYLAIASDIDWTTHQQFEKCLQVVCDQNGLGFAGSAFTLARDSRWPAWAQYLRPTSPNESVRLENHRLFDKWIQCASLDTFHGVTHSFDVIPMIEKIELNAGEEIKIVRSIDLSNYEGFLLIARGQYEAFVGPRIFVEWQGEESGIEITDVELFTNESNTVAIYRIGLDLIASKMMRGMTIKNHSSKKIEIMTLETAYATGRLVTSLLKKLPAEIVAPVFTVHGGCNKDYGGALNRTGKEIYPLQTPFAIDAKDNPFYCLSAFKARNVYFYNVVGNFSDSKLYPIAELLESDQASSGEKLYYFCRYFSTRYVESNTSPLWGYGKHGATVQGFPTNIEDVLQKFHWASFGTGCVIYTHLGHRLGNQADDHLGWPDETLMAWRRLSEYYFGRDSADPVPFQVWFAPTSSILTYSAVARELQANFEKHIKVIGNCIYLESWFDPFVGHRIPEIKKFGTSWLHGLTFYVSEPSQMRVFIDSVETQYFTTNAADETGQLSITLVDSNNPTQILEELAVTKNVSSVKPIEVSSLRNVTHWSFEVLTNDPDSNWSISLMDGLGAITEASRSSIVGSTQDYRNSQWRRFTLALHSARGPQRISGEVKNILVKAKAERVDSEVRFRKVELLRPIPTKTLGRE